MKLYMGNTTIAAVKTAAEIQSLLVDSGARQVNLTYRDGEIRELKWTMPAHGRELCFSLPVRSEAVLKLLSKQRKRGRYSEKATEELRKQAERVAWRQLLRWVQAQMALIQTGMVTTDEVFLPYLCAPNGQTLYQQMCSTAYQIEGPK